MKGSDQPSVSFRLANGVSRWFFKGFILFIFVMYVFACVFMSICAHGCVRVGTETRKGCVIPWNGCCMSLEDVWAVVEASGIQTLRLISNFY